MAALPKPSVLPNLLLAKQAWTFSLALDKLYTAMVMKLIDQFM
jgi:hypothetical protein